MVPMRFKVGFVTFLSCLALMLVLFASTGVASASKGVANMNAQWGTFIQQHGLSFNGTLNAAQTSLERHGYQIFNSTAANDGMVLGRLGDVIVQVTCRPLNDGRTYVIVSAFSEDASAAEQARNIIRQDIQNTINID